MLKKWSILVALCAAIPSVAQAEEQATRFGTLTVDSENILHFQGRPVAERVQGNNSLSFEQSFQFPGYDLVLVQDNGGTGCPAQYHIVKVTRAGASATKAFGTCSDLARTTKTKTGLLVTMPDFSSAVQGEAAMHRAARQRHSFTYANGKIQERVSR